MQCLLMSPLKAAVSRKMKPRLVTLETAHLLMSPLKDVAPEKADDIEVTADTSHLWPGQMGRPAPG